MNNTKKLMGILLIATIFPLSALSQTDEDLDVLVSDTKNDLLVVVGGGLAGAILGLSTLSFVEEPKEHTRNIIVGASIGIIAGVGYVAFSQASKSRNMLYNPESEETVKNSIKQFDTYARADWHSEVYANHNQIITSPYQVELGFRF